MFVKKKGGESSNEQVVEGGSENRRKNWKLISKLFRYLIEAGDSLINRKR